MPYRIRANGKHVTLARSKVQLIVCTIFTFFLLHNLVTIPFLLMSNKENSTKMGIRHKILTRVAGSTSHLIAYLISLKMIWGSGARSKLEQILSGIQKFESIPVTVSQIQRKRNFYYWILSKYQLLKPLMDLTNKLLSLMLLLSVGFYIPFFAFQTSIVFTNAAEQFSTLMFHCVRQYSSLLIFMGIPSEIHRQASNIHAKLLNSKLSPKIDTNSIIRLSIDREMSALSLKVGSFYVISYEFMATVICGCFQILVMSNIFLRVTESYEKLNAQHDPKFMSNVLDLVSDGASATLFSLFIGLLWVGRRGLVDFVNSTLTIQSKSSVALRCVM
ncbi:unnamed protein product [Orchesella dallaii]|uniref:Gustatory receptor n=1 Tax=Orchesella dallaii TaxID=48710 RepID=A0ABP1QGH9_9HEXA